MTQTAGSPTVELSRLRWHDLGLWAGAAALVLGAHVAVAYAVQSFSPIETDGGPPPAPVIEMEPMMVTPAVPEQSAMLDAVAPDQSEPTPTTEPTPQEQVDKAKPVVEQPDTTPPDETEPTQTDMAEQVDQPPPDEVIPDIAEAIAPEVVVPLPQPKPLDLPKDKKPVEKPKPRPKKEKPEPARTVATASAETKPAAKAAAPKSAAGVSGFSPAKWESRLTAWINRHKRYPSGAKSRRSQGNTNVAFTVDSSGQVLSASVVRSSGDPELDRAALAVLQGAMVPAPPPELGARVNRTAPFVFSLRD